MAESIADAGCFMLLFTLHFCHCRYNIECVHGLLSLHFVLNVLDMYVYLLLLRFRVKNISMHIELVGHNGCLARVYTYLKAWLLFPNMHIGSVYAIKI